MEQSLKFFKKNESSKFYHRAFFKFSLSDQKKIVNEIKVDSGLKLSSINEGQTFGDMFLSYQKDINVGAKFSFFDTEKSKLNLSFLKALYNRNKKVYFMKI